MGSVVGAVPRQDVDHRWTARECSSRRALRRGRKAACCPTGLSGTPRQWERYPEIRFANADRLAVDTLHLQEILTAVKKLPDVERRNTIPHAKSSFIGREREQTELRKKILNYSLVTVVGAPGVGRTRLTIQAARSLESDFDAIWFVPLSQLSELGSIL